MHKEIIYSPFSKVCLEHIAYQISLDSKRKAKIFIGEIISQVENLSSFPYMGFEIEKNVRKLVVHKNYIVFYEIIEEKLIILSVKNSKNN